METQIKGIMSYFSRFWEPEYYVENYDDIATEDGEERCCIAPLIAPQSTCTVS